ncbi:MAG: hypothetical protein FJY75_10340 [Candidatus Eisenbacteria bacterium]|uniref:Uncharacterized protein n=1 Tax=Eiseniibacteriota bacterium TaxID=2212470 RepID=A0A937XCV0_UNCEI|nr:hypothetical protein [Candidatus Eisenbacteria bacterium]
MKAQSRTSQYVVCVSNRGYAASLVVRRLYPTIADPGAAERGLLRVIDESGEGYLYPTRLFAAVGLSAAVARRFLAAARPGR